MSEAACERGDVEINGIFGGWGSGKTGALVRKFAQLCVEHEWDSTKYKPTANPTSALIAPTYKILKHATLAALEEVAGDLIIKRRGHPDNSLLWANGHKTLLVSGEAELEGLSLTHVGIDEVQHPSFSSRQYLNYLARCRDARVRRLALVAAGLPESTWVRDVFDKPESDHQLTLLAATRDNPYITPARLQTFLEQCPSGEEKRLIEGRWMAPIGAIYPQYDPTLHIVDAFPDSGVRITREALANIPVHLTMDVGNQACLLVWIELDVPIRGITGHIVGKKTALLCVGQLLPERASVEEIALRFKTETNFHLRPGYSRIVVDPKTDRDERHALKRHFEGCRVVQFERSDDEYYVDTGIRWTQAALNDSFKNVRLFFWRALEGPERGILNSVSRYRRNPDTGRPVKDNTHDHQVDALRYAVCEFLPGEKGKPRTLAA